jgi:hypothetical protein
MRIIFNKIALVFLLVFLTQISFCQIASVEDYIPNLEKEKKYLPYLAVWHGGIDKIEEWKKKNTILYYQELWYYTESFYIKRDHLSEGVEMDEAMIDVSRWEDQREEETEKIVILGGYKDVLILIPKNRLKYKPAR